MNNYPTWPGWETVRKIGTGSFGAVYEIEREMFGEKEKAALKVITIPQNEGDADELRNDGYDEESITAAFQGQLKSIVSEYSLMRKLGDSANVVNCDDVRYIQHENGVGWDIYIKMELLTPLTIALPKQISEEQAIRIGTDLCKALVLCRKHDIIHRDIKPQNIFVSANGYYKLGDFGVAKTMEKTTGGTIIGTYKYMAPEVYNNRPYGAAADIYSLGLVLYWVLNERRMPFLPLPPETLTSGIDEAARLRRLNGEQIPAPKHGSDSLKRIVLKACAYLPEDRYRSASEMLAELEALKPGNHKAWELVPEQEPVPMSAPESMDDSTTVRIRRDSGVKPTAEATTDNGRGQTVAFPEHEKASTNRFCTVLCKKCGKVLSEGEKLCRYCGANQADDELKPAGKRSNKLIILCAVGAILLAGVGIFLGKTIGGGNAGEETAREDNKADSGAVSLENTIVGDTIVFGAYEQDNDTENGKEAIEWLVLDKQDNKLLVISKYALDSQEYNNDYAVVTWQTCSLRSWMNGTFLKDAFSEEEQKQISTTRVSADKNPKYNAMSGNATKDRVFLLSITEAEEYFSSDADRKCAPTAYAVAQGAWPDKSDKTVSGEAACNWWLRSPGYESRNAAIVLHTGQADYVGSGVARSFLAVRPAMWISY